jgi:hypothetical protein
VLVLLSDSTITYKSSAPLQLVLAFFDASSGSYSLTKGPGDSSGLTFQWACMNFITDSLYKLVQLNIDPTTLFNDVTVEETKWYQTDFTTHIEEQGGGLTILKYMDSSIQYVMRDGYPIFIYNRYNPISYAPELIVNFKVDVLLPI